MIWGLDLFNVNHLVSLAHQVSTTIADNTSLEPRLSRCYINDIRQELATLS